jgi:chemotaxis response regulator CheB
MTDSEMPPARPGRIDGQASKGRLPIVAIGASAGRVKALQEFFAAQPNRVGVAFVVVVHLDPGSSSELPRSWRRGRG